MNSIKWRARLAGVIVAAGLATVAGAAVAFGAAVSGAAQSGSVPTLAVVTAGHGSANRPAGATSLIDPDGTPASTPATLVANSGRGSEGATTAHRFGRPPTLARGDGADATARSAQAVSRSHTTPSATQLLAGVGPLPTGWMATAHGVTVDGMHRVYLTLGPAHVSSPIPVVVVMHGRDMSPDGILHISALADRIGPALLVLPAGWNESWNSGDCCGPAYRHHIDDVAFIHAALDQAVSSNPAVASSPVYAIGFSNGGRMAYQLACDLPGVFRGIMAVEAVPVERCPAMRPLDVTVVAQQSDPLLTVGAGARPKIIGGFVERTVAATIAHLAALDHCAPAAAAVDLGAAVERSWSCAWGTRLRYVWYPGGSHSWRRPTATTPGATDFARQMLGLADRATVTVTAR